MKWLNWDASHKVPSELFLAHLLATNDVRIACELAARHRGWDINVWVDDTALKGQQMKDYVTLTGTKGGTQRAAIVPDGYFVLEAGDFAYHFFLELDMGTETAEASVWGRRDWARKVAAYLEYQRSGGFERRYGARSFRVLTVTTTEKRLFTLKAATERAGGKGRFWFTSFAEVTAESIFTQPIWQEAGRVNARELVE